MTDTGKGSRRKRAEDAYHKRAEREAMRFTDIVQWLGERVEYGQIGEPDITALRIKKTTGSGEGYLAVITATSAEGHVVAFQSGRSLVDVLTGVGERLRNKTLKWKEDEYA